MTRFAKGSSRKAERERSARREERRLRWSLVSYTVVIWAWRIGLPIFVVAIGQLIVADIGTSWTARFGSGTHGTYTATHRDCDGSKRCVWRGTFVSDDGSVRRTDVGLGAGVGIDHIGQTQRAVDTGNRINVYPTGGGWDWIVVSLVAVAVAVGFVLWARSVVSALREWRAERAERAEEAAMRSRTK